MHLQHKMTTPLVSEQSTVEFLSDIATSSNVQCDDTSVSSREALALAYGFENWEELMLNARKCCVLLDRSTIVFTRRLKLDLASAWHLVSDAKELSTWMFETKLELRVGGPFQFPTWGGVIGKLEKLRCLRFVADEGGYSEFQIESISTNETLVKVVDFLPPHLEVPKDVIDQVDSEGSAQPGGPGTHWPGVLAGWHSGTDSLEAYAHGIETDSKYVPLMRLYAQLLNAYHARNP